MNKEDTIEILEYLEETESLKEQLIKSTDNAKVNRAFELYTNTLKPAFESNFVPHY